MQIINLSTQPFSPELYQDLCERLNPARVFERPVRVFPDVPLGEQIEEVVKSTDWSDSIVNLPNLPIAAGLIARKIEGRNVHLLRLKSSTKDGEKTLIFSEVVPLTEE